jgi:DNA-binding NarL/FixJ family response regulator
MCSVLISIVLTLSTSWA